MYGDSLLSMQSVQKRYAVCSCLFVFVKERYCRLEYGTKFLIKMQLVKGKLDSFLYWSRKILLHVFCINKNSEYFYLSSIFNDIE